MDGRGETGSKLVQEGTTDFSRSIPRGNHIPPNNRKKNYINMIMWTISLFSKQTAKSLDNTNMDYNLLNEFIRFDNIKKSYKKRVVK